MDYLEKQEMKYFILSKWKLEQIEKQRETRGLLIALVIAFVLYSMI